MASGSSSLSVRKSTGSTLIDPESAAPICFIASPAWLDVALAGSVAELLRGLLDLGGGVDGLRGLLLAAGGERQCGGGGDDGTTGHGIAFLDGCRANGSIRRCLTFKRCMRAG